MRFDPKIGTELNLTPRQKLFAEVWFNQVHEYSLDAFRVRAMNPTNSVQEMLRTLAQGSPVNDKDRRRIWGETFSILSGSTVLNDARFQVACGELCSLVDSYLSKTGKATSDPKESISGQFPLIEAFARELDLALRTHFIPACIQWLSVALAEPVVAGTIDPKADELVEITGQLLSSLVGDGWSLESLFSLYRRTFHVVQSCSADEPIFDFEVALRWIFERLVRDPKPYTVTFAVSQISRATSFPAQVGDIDFSTEPPTLGAESSSYAQRYAKRGGSKLFATMTVQANDGRIAGMRAAMHIEQVLDVVRYDFERRNFSLSESFLVEKQDRHMLLDVSRTVPNPRRDLSSDNLSIFMRQLNDLASSGNLDGDSKDRIYSAFRLYRTGAETVNLENKLVNWWTALEFLVKAGASGSIGDAVENALVPTVTLAYVAKHLYAIRAALHVMRIEVPHPTSNQVINFSSIDLSDLFELSLDTKFQNCLLELVAYHPYAVLQIKAFFNDIKSTDELLKTLSHHEHCVRWQIQRIYRARCDIVHSAGRIGQATLLCANLESYLKILLDSFLQSLHRHSTLRTPTEFFDRQRHTFGRVSSELGCGKNTLLLQVLRTQG